MGSSGSKIGRRMTRGISGKWKTSEGGGGCSSNHFSASMPPGGGLNNYCGGGTSNPHNTPPCPRSSLPHSSWPLALLYQAATPFITIATRPFICFGRRSLPPDLFTADLILLEEIGESADGKLCRKLKKVCLTSVRPVLSPHRLHL